MRILAIETSCDETAVCIVEAAGIEDAFSYRVLGNALYSQVAVHQPYGGVFPNLAKREHAKNLVPLLKRALADAKLLALAEKPSVQKDALDTLREILAREPELFAQLVPFFAQYSPPAIDALAVTHGPGLEPALWVGVNFAKALSVAWGIPLVPVNHMEGHIVVSAASEGRVAPLAYPALAVLISGGHTELVLMPSWLSYERIGETRDDAVGEAFDKVARVLGLPYPGGPEISARAQHARDAHIASPFTLPRAMLHSGDLDFSFSGIKTAVRNEVQKLGPLNAEHISGIAREFEDAVADICAGKLARAIVQSGAQTVIVGGGVAANGFLMQRLLRVAQEHGARLSVCPPQIATDNALMIALAGYARALRGEYKKPPDIQAHGTLPLGAPRG